MLTQQFPSCARLVADGERRLLRRVCPALLRVLQCALCRGESGRASVLKRFLLYISGRESLVQERLGGSAGPGQGWSQDEDSVELTGSRLSTGSDKLGKFTDYQYEWKVTGGASTLRFLTAINVYEEVPAVWFALVFLDKATNTNIYDYVNLTLSTFPSFVIEDGPVERGYVTWSGNSE